MEAMARIGECFWLGTCLLAVFLVLSLLTSVKFGILIKFAIPIFGFLIGMCMGIFLGSLFSPTTAQIVAIPFGLVGAFLGVSMSNQSKGL
jgi:hypothetical protein